MSTPPRKRGSRSAGSALLSPPRPAAPEQVVLTKREDAPAVPAPEDKILIELQPRDISDETLFLAHREALADNEVYDVWDEAHLANLAWEPPVLEDAEPEDPQEVAWKAWRDAVAAMSPDEPVYLAGNRAPKLKVHNHKLDPGDIVPGAARFPRLQAWVDSGHLVKA